jgi:two-component system LytT family response regulator
MICLKTIIIDDEINSRDVLKRLIETRFKDDIEVVAQASNVEEAYQLIQLHHPDLIFLDIQMPKANGFKLLSKYTEIPFEVIFVTSYDNYAINAIKFNALDYLLKPVEITDLEFAVKKAISTIEKKINSSAQIINLVHSLETDNSDKKIAVHVNDCVKLISENDIMYLEAERRYCHLYTESGQHYFLAKFLKDFEDYFSEKSNFIRISKSLIINALHIKEYSKGDPFIIKMKNDCTFETARRKKTEVLLKIKNLK